MAQAPARQPRARGPRGRVPRPWPEPPKTEPGPPCHFWGGAPAESQRGTSPRPLAPTLARPDPGIGHRGPRPPRASRPPAWGAVGGAWGWCTAAPRFSAWPVGSSTFSGTTRLRAGVGSIPVNRRLQLGCLQLGRLYWGVSGVLHTQGPSGGTAAGFTGLLFRTRGGSARGERAVSLGGGQAGWPGRPRTAQHRAAACAPFLGRQAWFGGQRSPASVLWPPLLSTRPGELAWSLGQEGLRAVTAEPGGLVLAQHSQAGPPG